MIRIALLLFAAPLICAAESFAKNGPVTATAKAAPCAACKEMEMLEKRFNGYHANVPNQYTTASDPVMMKPVLDLSMRLHKEAKNRRGSQFYQELESLVSLVASSLPFDIETQGAADLVQIIRAKDAEEKARDPKDKRPTKTRLIYATVVGQIRDQCRRKLLETQIKERECNLDFEAAKKPEKYLDKECPLSKFDYKECEAERK